MIKLNYQEFENLAKVLEEIGVPEDCLDHYDPRLRDVPVEEFTNLSGIEKSTLRKIRSILKQMKLKRKENNAKAHT